MAQNSGASTLIGAVVIAVSVVLGAFVIRGSLDRTAVALENVEGALASLEEVAQQAPARPVRAGAERPRRPDPSRRYSVDLEGAPTKGPDDAKVTVVEFSDFQCPFCARAKPTLAQIQQTYGDDVRIAFKHLPLRIHPQAPGAHAAAEAAHRQGKFWEMHDLIFQNQRELSEEKYLEYANQLGLDVDQFKKDSASPDVKKRVDADTQEAMRLGVTGTPGFFINGRFLSGAQPFEAFKTVIDEEIEAKG